MGTSEPTVRSLIFTASDAHTNGVRKSNTRHLNGDAETDTHSNTDD